MAENETDHIGGINQTEEQRTRLALKSLKHCSDDEQFGKLFPEIKEEIDEKLKADPKKYGVIQSKKTDSKKPVEKKEFLQYMFGRMQLWIE